MILLTQDSREEALSSLPRSPNRTAVVFLIFYCTRVPVEQESTTMAIIGERWGLFPKLKEWVAEEKPIWGTCAGMILLSDHAIKQAQGGQSLVGGLDVHVCRNFFGSQTYSCQLDVTLDTKLDGLLGPGYESGGSCPAIFIRAPVILSVGPNVDVLARTVATPHASAKEAVLKSLESANGTEGSMAAVIDCIAGIDLDSSVQPRSKRRRLSKATSNLDTINKSCERSYEVFVAVRQRNILATAFHPELTEDLRWHRCNKPPKFTFFLS